MATFLFDKIVFGPVKSRRLGISLGINLSPLRKKFCNFDCIYCECGLNASGNQVKDNLPTRKMVYDALHDKLELMHTMGEIPDVITFAGNGEPTIHPDFAEIIDDTIALRNKFFLKSKISVLSNATMLHKQSIIDALLKVDQNILKLDSGLDTTIAALNQPVNPISVKELVRQLQQFKGKVIIQSLFTRGNVGNKYIDNTTASDLDSWIGCLNQIQPEMVMIYTIDRDTPYEGLKKVPLTELKAIAHRVNLLDIKTQVKG